MTRETIDKYYRGNASRFYLKYLPDAKRTRNQEWRAICPFHKDTKPSLNFNNETGAFYCFGCGAKGGIGHFFSKLKGLEGKDNYPRMLKEIASEHGLSDSKKPRRIAKTYDYTDEQNRLLFQVVRYEPKGFHLRRPDGNGRWIWGLNGQSPILYRLPELLKAETVLIVEGEKDADTAVGLGFCATTAPMGAASTWRPEFSEHLRGKNVVLIPDNDSAGREHMQKVAKSLNGIAASIKWLDLPDLPQKGDLTDWFKLQKDNETAFERLSKIIESAPDWTSIRDEDVTSSDSKRSDNQSFKCTDLGNAERMVSLQGQDLRYCYPWSKWLVWTGKQWAPDDQGEVERRAKMTVRAICREITPETDEDRVKEVYKHAARSESDSKLRAMVNLARMELPILPDDLDRDHCLFNVINGTVDLKTGELLPHTREDFIGKIAQVEFDQKARCPIWLNFLDRIFNGRLELINYIQRVVGYALTGDTTAQCFFLLWGTGANGKSTFLETIRILAGDYGHQSDFQTFLAKRTDSGQSNDLASLKGSRIVTASEAGAGRSLNEALIKTVTGGEPIRARFLYGEFFEFKPQFKLFLATNHKPRIRDTDLGIWRRVKLIPFEVTIPSGEQDTRLLEKLSFELPGILNWALAGCKDWLLNGLAEPRIVLNATSEYRESEDVLASFFEDTCVYSQGARVKTSDLKNAYKSWCESNSEEPVSNRAFAGYLETRGCKPMKIMSTRYWCEIGLKNG